MFRDYSCYGRALDEIAGRDSCLKIDRYQRIPFRRTLDLREVIEPLRGTLAKYCSESLQAATPQWENDIRRGVRCADTVTMLF